MEYIKNTGERINQRGPTPWPRGWGRALLPRGPPSGSSVPIFCYMKSFVREKNHKQAFGTKRRRLKAKRGQDQSRAAAELFCRGNIPLGGGNHHHRSSHRLGINLHQHLHQHHLLLNPSSSLVSNLCPKTSDWYLWVASSVDYSL